MKKMLWLIFKGILGLILMIGIIVVCFLLLRLPYTAFYKCEKTLFYQFYGSSVFCFPNLYLLHAVTICGLLLYGTVRFFYDFIFPFLKYLGNLLKVQRNTYFYWLTLIFFVVIIEGFLLFKEQRYRQLSYSPGSAFPGNDFSQENPEISYRVIADERGMTHFDPDSFLHFFDSTFIVNKQGFPSVFDFDKQAIDSLIGFGSNKKRKVLWLGDSFLEGVGATTHDKSFLEIFIKRNPGLLVCNTGIGGMDPVQYRLVAEKYAPVIQPDEISVFFCGWNDALWVDRKPVPFVPYYSELKNVGFISNYLNRGIAQDSTLVLPTAEAYKLYRNRFSLMDKNDFRARICRKLNITTQLYYAANPVQYYPFHYADDSLATYRNLIRIKQIADSVGSKFSIYFVPTPVMKNYSREDYESHFYWAFKDLWNFVHLCPKQTIEEKHCITSQDFHFNDKGQVKYADYLQKEFERR